MSRTFVDDSWSDFSSTTDEAVNALKTGDEIKLPETQVEADPNTHALDAGSEEWTEEMIFGESEEEEAGIDEESLSEDETPSEELASDEDQELEESIDEDAVELSEDEQEESSLEDELPPTEVIKANGQRTVIDYDMSNPRNRQKFKTAVQMAAAYKKLHGHESVLRNELKESDLSFLKVEDPYSKEGMKRIGLAIKGMGKLTELANTGDLDGLFRTITRSEDHPDGIGIHDYVESKQQEQVDYENMSEAEKRAYDLQQELKEERKELARLRNIEEQKSESLAQESLNVRQQERKNQVLPIFQQLKIKAEDVGGSSTRALKQNKTLWNETREFCKRFEAETGSLPDESTLSKFIKDEIQDLIGYRKQAIKKQETKQKVAKKAEAKKKAATAVKSKSLKDTKQTSIEDEIKSWFS